MSEDKKTTPAVPADANQSAPAMTGPVTFRDKNYRLRNIEIGKDKLRVENHQVTTDNPKLIEALDNMPGMERVNA